MKVDDLPAIARPYPGESIVSWLHATRRVLKLPEFEWWAWCGCCPSEPERKATGEEWGRLPEELGRIEQIPAAWRVAGAWRELACPCCRVSDEAGDRYPVLVDWLDVRSIACREHQLLLSQYVPRAALPVSSQPELQALFEWLEQWRNGDLERADARLRRDLVIASGRNWDPSWGGIASSELTWVIEGMGWQLPRSRRAYPPFGPVRIGELPLVDRAAALLGAYRAWQVLNGADSPNLPDWPNQAWAWLGRRARALPS